MVGLDAKPVDGIVACDVADGAAVEGGMAEAVAQLGRLDIVVTAAALTGLPGGVSRCA